MAEGKFWCNGFDLATLGERDRRGVRQFLSETQKLWARLLVFPLPTVAAIQGHAFGAGAVSALAHDYRVMREDRGFFCLPEIDLKLRFRPGMMALLQAKLTPRVALDALLTGARFGGPDAAASTLVDEAVPLERLRDAAHDRVKDLIGKDRRTLHHLKLSMYKGAYDLLHGDDPERENP